MRPLSLIFASSNDHKIQEVSSLLGSSFSLSGLHDHGILEEIAENGHSFEENAKIKAEYVFKKTGLDVFADDSGLEVEALSGAPGIFSARYSGTRNMKENLVKVLKDLGDSVNRKAQFHCSISLVFRGNFYFFEGIIEGEILHEPRGLEGFGYDPIFRPLGYHQTFAELGMEEKNAISHRALALEKMKLTIEKLSRE